jgi:SAM-dependent methyltransferase
MSRVHSVASEGYAAAADAYVRARPGYPAAAVDWLLAETGSGTVVEVGAGTGKFTVELVERGVGVVAVEPVAEMRERLPVEAIDAVAEELPFADASVARIVASQSLHWVDVDRAFSEFDRVLASGGAVGLVWNFRDVDVPWQRELDSLLAELRGAAPHSRDGRWQRAVATSAFVIAAHREWRWEVQTDIGGVIDRVRSVSYVAALPPRQQRTVDERVRQIIERHGLSDDAIAFPYVTEAYVLRRGA